MSKLNQTSSDSGLLELVAKHSKLLSTVAGLLDSVFVRLEKLEQPHADEVEELHADEVDIDEARAAIAAHPDELPPLEVRYECLAHLVQKVAPLVDHAVEHLSGLAETSTEMLAFGQLQAAAEYLNLFKELVEDAERKEAGAIAH